MPSNKPVTQSELGNLISRELSYSDNRQGSESQQNSSRAYDYFLYRPKGDEVEGRSQVQSGDVADMVDHVAAEIQPMYSVDELIAIKPENNQDVKQADLETKALNWYFRERCRGFEKLDDAIQDGLLLRNGYLKVWAEDAVQLPFTETLEGTSEEINQSLYELGQQGEVRILNETVLQEATAMVATVVGPDGITPVDVEQEVSPEIARIEVMVLPQRREIRIECVPREDMFVSRDADGQNMQAPRFIAHRRWMTRNEAIGLGFDSEQVGRISPTNYVNQQTKVSRMSDAQKLNTKAAHDGGDIVNIYECYYLLDMDGDGIAERHKIFYSNSTDVLRWAETGEPADEIVRLVPFAAGVPLKVAHRHQGRSLFDKERMIEDSKRALLRQGLDNIEGANNRRPLLGPGVNPDDVEETEIGSYIRCEQGIDQYGETGYTPIFDKSLLGLQYLDKMRNERGGSSIESSGAQQPVNVAAHTFERAMSATEQLAAMMMRNFGNTLIRDTFSLLHQQLKLSGESFQFEDGDDWQTVEPRFWQDRERFSVQLGKSAGEKMRHAAALESTIAKQFQVMQTGGDNVLTGSYEMYSALTDQGNAQGLTDPDRYWIDPNSEQAQQARAQKAQQAQQQQQMQMQMAQQQQQMMLQLEQMRQQGRLQEQAMQNEVNAMKANLDHLGKLLDSRIKLVELNAEYDQEPVPDTPGELQ